MVVLQVLPALNSGGVERGTLEMVQAIAEAGGTALVASAGGRLVPQIERFGGRHFILPLDTKNPAAIWRNADHLASPIRTTKAGIVHARSRAPGWSALLASRRTGTHLVTTYHGAYKEDWPLKRQYNRVMASGERVIAISHFIARLIAEQHAVDPGRVRIIPRGVDPTIFNPALVSPERTERLARAWELPRSTPIVMLPGRLARWKGQEVLISALARCQEKPLAILVGSDPKGRARSLMALARGMGMADRVRWVGECGDMPAALLLGDLIVSASTEPEAFGRVVIEAQAMERPVIVTDHGGAAETVRQGYTGWRVKPGDAGALAKTIDEALRLSAGQRASIGAAARKHVLSHYTAAAMQAATLAVYRELI